MFSSVISVLRSTLSPQTALDAATGYLENAHKAKNSELALMYCTDAEATLSRIKRSARKDLISSLRVEDRALCQGIAAAYSELGKILERWENSVKAKASYAKAEKWG